MNARHNFNWIYNGFKASNNYSYIIGDLSYVKPDYQLKLIKDIILHFYSFKNIFLKKYNCLKLLTLKSKIF